MSHSQRVRSHQNPPLSRKQRLSRSHNSFSRDGSRKQKVNPYYQGKKPRRQIMLHHRPLEYLRAYGTRTELDKDDCLRNEKSFEEQQYQLQILANHGRIQDIQLQRQRKFDQNKRWRQTLQRDLEQAKNQLRQRQKNAQQLQEKTAFALINCHQDAFHLKDMLNEDYKTWMQCLERVRRLESQLWRLQREG